MRNSPTVVDRLISNALIMMRRWHCEFNKIFFFFFAFNRLAASGKIPCIHIAQAPQAFVYANDGILALMTDHFSVKASPSNQLFGIKLRKLAICN